jgi:hypothetical protein
VLTVFYRQKKGVEQGSTPFALGSTAINGTFAALARKFQTI